MSNDADNSVVVHHRIKEWREYRKLRQEDLGAMIGMDQSTISKWERGISHPTTADIDALAKALETTPSNLLATIPGQEDLYEEVVTRIQGLTDEMRAAVFTLIKIDPDKAHHAHRGGGGDNQLNASGFMMK